MQSDKLFSVESLGELFHQVQVNSIFPDSKFFVDCSPKSDPEKILENYQREKNEPDFDLKLFVENHFQFPEENIEEYHSEGKTIEQHLEQLWQILKREPDNSSGTLIDLPNSYIVPGGRFREVYYWDSYFTMLGLKVSGKEDMIQNMLDNFAYLIDQVGFIPNGNRTYYLGRSQPPFFSLMVEVLAESNDSIILKYLPQLQKEYDFWMDGESGLTSENTSYRRVVLMPDGSVLNRYWDDNETPRPESYREDLEIAEESGEDPKKTFRNIRAAAESGWDFGSRWFADGEKMRTIRTTDLVPVDLNCLLFHLEEMLMKAYQLTGQENLSLNFKTKSESRKLAINKYFWDDQSKFYFDYSFQEQKLSQEKTLAGCFPLFFKVASNDQANYVNESLRIDFLKPGGLQTTLKNTGQQWDSPNGWAPLQWMAVQGLENYGHHELAKTISNRWIALNEKVYARTGKMMEKYNVLNLDLDAGGGEYPSQDGFGWTNGVYLKMKKTYK